MNDILIEYIEKPGFWCIVNKIMRMVLLTILYSLCALITLCIIEPFENIYLGMLFVFFWMVALACALRDDVEDLEKL